MKRLILVTLVVAVFGVAKWPELAPAARVSAPIRPDPAREVVLLSASWCPYCTQARAFLHENGILFAEHDVENTEEGRRAYEALGRGGVPILLVDGVLIRGMDLGAWAAALSSAEHDREQP